MWPSRCRTPNGARQHSGSVPSALPQDNARRMREWVNTAGEQLTKRIALALLSLLVANRAALATNSISSSSALALASLVAENSSLINADEKKVMMLLFDGTVSVLQKKL
jgi:hypothetical protein